MDAQSVASTSGRRRDAVAKLQRARSLRQDDPLEQPREELSASYASASFGPCRRSASDAHRRSTFSFHAGSRNLADLDDDVFAAPRPSPLFRHSSIAARSLAAKAHFTGESQCGGMRPVLPSLQDLQAAFTSGDRSQIEGYFSRPHDSVTDSLASTVRPRFIRRNNTVAGVTLPQYFPESQGSRPDTSPPSGVRNARLQARSRLMRQLSKRGSTAEAADDVPPASREGSFSFACAPPTIPINALSGDATEHLHSPEFRDPPTPTPVSRHGSKRDAHPDRSGSYFDFSASGSLSRDSSVSYRTDAGASRPASSSILQSSASTQHSSLYMSRGVASMSSMSSFVPEYEMNEDLLYKPLPLLPNEEEEQDHDRSSPIRNAPVSSGPTPTGLTHDGARDDIDVYDAGHKFPMLFDPQSTACGPVESGPLASGTTPTTSLLEPFHETPGLPTPFIFGPVLQVSSQTLVKDRFIFVIGPVLIVSKPYLSYDTPTIPSMDTPLFVKSIMPLSHVIACPLDEDRTRANRHVRPLPQAWLVQYENTPEQVVFALLAKLKIPLNDTANIASALVRTPNLSPFHLSAFFEALPNSSLAHSIMSHFFHQFQDAITTLLLTDVIRLAVSLSGKLDVPEILLNTLCETYLEARGHFPHLSTLMRWCLDTDREWSCDEFISGYNRYHPDEPIDRRLLTHVYDELMACPLSRADFDESSPGDTPLSRRPDNAHSIPAASSIWSMSTSVSLNEPLHVSFSIPAPDSDFSILVVPASSAITVSHSLLTFDQTPTAHVTLMFSSFAAEPAPILFIRRGTNANKYSGIPTYFPLSTHRTFMDNTFTLTFVNEQNHERRRYMFSCATPAERDAYWSAITAYDPVIVPSASHTVAADFLAESLNSTKRSVTEKPLADSPMQITREESENEHSVPPRDHSNEHTVPPHDHHSLTPITHLRESLILPSSPNHVRKRSCSMLYNLYRAPHEPPMALDNTVDPIIDYPVTGRDIIDLVTQVYNK